MSSSTGHVLTVFMNYVGKQLDGWCLNMNIILHSVAQNITGGNMRYTPGYCGRWVTTGQRPLTCHGAERPKRQTLMLTLQCTNDAGQSLIAIHGHFMTCVILILFAKLEA